MFNWLVSIFMIASIIILFAAWTRIIRIKDLLRTEAAQVEWGQLRILVFIALVVEAVLLILALIGARIPFAYVGAIFIIYLSYLFFHTSTFFLTSLEKRPPMQT